MICRPRSTNDQASDLTESQRCPDECLTNPVSRSDGLRTPLLFGNAGEPRKRLPRCRTHTGVGIGVAQALQPFSGMALLQAEACLGLLGRGLRPAFPFRISRCNVRLEVAEG